MFARKKIATGVLTLAVAIATGHVMQYGIAPEEHVEGPVPRPSEARPARPGRSDDRTGSSSSALFPEPTVDSGRLEVPQPPEAVSIVFDLPPEATGSRFPADVSIAALADLWPVIASHELPCGGLFAPAPTAQVAPDCGDAGEILVLINTPQDLNIAQN